MRFSISNIAVCCGLTLSMLLTGCGSEVSGRVAPTAAVEGSVTFQGAGVAKGTVNFYSKDTGAAASTEILAGNFKLADKLPEGDYIVYVTAQAITQPPEPGKMPPPIEDPKDIPMKYRAAETSALSASLNPGSNTVKLELSP